MTRRRIGTGRPATRLAGISVAVAGGLRRALDGLAAWAARRSLAPNSLTGISLLFALCAAAWFSGGTTQDLLRGEAAVGVWFLAFAAAGGLSGFEPRETRAAGGRRSAPRQSPDRDTDWLTLPGLLGEVDEPGGGRAAVRAGTARQASRRADGYSWMAAVCAVASECAIYGGIAASDQRVAGNGIWALAIITVAATCIAGLIGACGGAVADHGVGWLARRSPAWRRCVQVAFAPGAVVRVLLASVVLLAAGPRLALFAVLAIEVLSVCCALLLRHAAARAGTIKPGVPAAVLMCRDDGPVARWAGRLVQGNLMPLPAALAGVVATAMLGLLGQAHLPWIIALAPPIVMMMAAPGSRHPHDGRADWLVPSLLVIAQFVYIAGLGFAMKVPGPVIFALCGLIAVWYATIAASTTYAAPGWLADPAAAYLGLGWEARMFAAGLAAILGIATFGYIGLAAYLAVLICRKVMIGYLVPQHNT